MKPTLATLDPRQISREVRQSVYVHQQRQWHLVILAISILVIVAAFVLRFRQGEGLRLPWSDTALPTMCASRLMFGLECPGCGLTRSFVALAGGDFETSLGFNRIGWLLALAVVAQIPYRVFALRERRGHIVSRPWLAWLGYSLIAALVVNWLLKSLGI